MIVTPMTRVTTCVNSHKHCSHLSFHPKLVTVMHTHTRPLSEEQGKVDVMRIALLMANSIDCEVLSQLLTRAPSLQVVLASAEPETGFANIRVLLPQILIIDPKCAPDSVSRTVEAVIEGFSQRAILLDDRVREALVAAILPFSQVSYLTRQAGSHALIDAVMTVSSSGERVFDPSIAPRIMRSPRGWQLQLSPDQPSVAALTTRELEVLKLLAGGRSVRDCAQQLNLSESTIDNHKTRLMKKLQIHKLTELTHMAIRDGLISL
jgi:DNA-binding NarL/FixJ family response regulator